MPSTKSTNFSVSLSVSLCVDTGWGKNDTSSKSSLRQSPDITLPWVILTTAEEQGGNSNGCEPRRVRKYGYHGTPATLKAVRENEDIRGNLGAAAHLIHGSSEGRFRITYCPGPGMSREEIEKAGFQYGDLDEMLRRYPVKEMKDGMNVINGEEVFYISNPALGLWALREKFQD